MNEKALYFTLKQSYYLFRLFQSTFESLLIGETFTIQKKNLTFKIESFFPAILCNLKLNNGDITDILRSIQYRPVTNLIFFRIVNFINTITSIPVLKIKKNIFLFNNQVIYSELTNFNELFTIYEYLISSVLPKFDNENRSKKTLENEKNTGYFITQSEFISQKVYIYDQHKEMIECFFIIVYAIQDCFMIMLLSDGKAAH